MRESTRHSLDPLCAASGLVNPASFDAGDFLARLRDAIERGVDDETTHIWGYSFRTSIRKSQSPTTGAAGFRCAKDE